MTESPTTNSSLPVVISWDACRIVPYLYLGSATSVTGKYARDIMLSDEHKIAAIVNVTRVENAFPKDFEYLQIDIEDRDGVDIDKHFESANEFIHRHREAKQAVIVHCMAGSSRSATIVIAYLVRHCGYTLKAAFEHVLALRPVIDPNDSFRAQLMQYERLRSTLESNSIDLLSSEVRDGPVYRALWHGAMGLKVWSKLKWSSWWYDNENNNGQQQQQLQTDAAVSQLEKPTGDDSKYVKDLLATNE